MNTSSHDFDTFINTQLNAQQRKAVTHLHGPLLVIAGAGSGKTRVITARITDLILNRHVPARQIIALTFTNKAANEMKERIKTFLGSHATLPFIGTFHSYCVKLLKQYSHLLSVPFEAIIDADDARKIIKAILKKHGLEKKFSEKQIASQISTLKNNPKHDGNLDPLLYDIYNAYELEKRTSKLLDFDDLLVHAYKLFKNEEFKIIHQQSIRHILVDEYQDTNVIQHSFLKAMSLQSGKKLAIDSLCAVGDEAQSIYSWRGATVHNILNFGDDFENTAIIKIEQNYRSIQEILDVANKVITQNNSHRPKRLWSEKKGHQRIHVLNFASEYQEADTIAAGLLFIKQHTKTALSDVALLYRTHAQSRALEEALLKNNIPYRIIGGIQFYDRMEIKDLLAYLKLLANPFDRVSCARIINTPTRGIGQKFEELFFTSWNEQPLLSFQEHISHLLNTGNLTPVRAHALQTFAHIFADLEITTEPHVALQQIINRSGYVTYIKNSYDKEEADERLANIDELVSAFQHFQEQGTTNLQQILEEISLLQDRSAHAAETNDAVLLMTLHAAKGLEFNTAIITGLEEGVFPTMRASYDNESIEEERRLFYVGITRAQERLLMTRSQYRHTYGSASHQLKSRFLDDIPTHDIPHHECQFWRAREREQFFAQWLGIKTVATNNYCSFAQPSTERFTKPKIVTAPAAPKVKTNTGWRINQPVKHIKYGLGIVQHVETRSESTFLKIKFKTATKKISADFVSKI